MNNQPLVSIIISNYNYGHFLGNAIQSALRQTCDPIEVIVVDDGSTDHSQDVIRSFGDQIIPLFKSNGGQSSAMNAGFAKSRGQLICFLDADDVFMPDKISQIVALFQEREDIDWCFHLLNMVDVHSRQRLTTNDYESSGDWDYRERIKQGKQMPFTPSATSGLCFRRSLLQQILPIPEIIRITSDNYLKLTASALGKGFFINQELATQYVHPNNAYTLRDDRQKLKASILCLTAFGIRERFPFLKDFANGLFIVGIGTYWCAGKLKPDCSVINHYLSSLGYLERLRINLCAASFCFRNQFGWRHQVLIIEK